MSDATTVTAEDQVRFAQSLGLVLPQDEDLLWIVLEGLEGELPKNENEYWIRKRDPRTGKSFYFDKKTYMTTWLHPSTDKLRSLAQEERMKKIWKQDRREMALFVSRIAFKTSSSSSVGTVCREIYNVRVLVTMFAFPKWSTSEYTPKLVERDQQREAELKKNEVEEHERKLKMIPDFS